MIVLVSVTLLVRVAIAVVVTGTTLVIILASVTVTVLIAVRVTVLAGGHFEEGGGGFLYASWAETTARKRKKRAKTNFILNSNSFN